LSKKIRHEQIKRILRQRRVESQQDLVAALGGEGIEVTAATVSRDIAELSLVRKRDDSGKVRWALPEQEHLSWMLSELVSAIEAIRNMVIVKCSQGTAQGVAAAVDDMDWTEMAGTVAGDDTILMICRTDEEASNLAARLQGHA